MRSKRFWSVFFALAILLASMPANAAAKELRCLSIDTGASELTMAITDDDSLWAWGTYVPGMIDGSTVPVKIMEDVKACYCRAYVNYYIIKKDGTLWSDQSSKKIMDNAKEIYLFEDGFDYVIDNNNTLWRLDYNYDENYKTVITPVKLIDNVDKIYCHRGVTYVLKMDRTLWGWGDRTSDSWNYEKQDYEYMGIGDGTDETRLSPVKILDNVKDLVFYQYWYRELIQYGNQMIEPRQAYALKNDNTLWAWGHNDNGNLLDGTEELRLSPVKIMNSVKKIIKNDSGLFVIKTDDSLWEKRYVEGSRMLVRIMDNVKEFFNDSCHYFALAKDNSLWGWGNNDYQVIGTGSDSEYIETPTKVLDNVLAFSTTGGAGVSMAIKEDKSLWVWGYEDSIMSDWVNEIHTPKKYDENVKSIFAGHNGAHYYIKEDGSLWGWGSNECYYGSGVLGNGSKDPTAVPQRIRFIESASENKPVIERVNVSKSGGSYMFNISADNITRPCELITALYKGDDLVSVKATPLHEDFGSDFNITMLAGEADNAKVFMWESINSIKALCNAQRVYIE